MVNLSTILASVRRHWAVAALGVAVTIGAVSQVPDYVSGEYKVEGSVILLSPAVVAGPQGDVTVNPWSRFGSSESGAAAALVQILRSALVDGLVVDGEAVNDFEISVNPANGAIIDLTLTAGEEDLALAAYAQGLDMIVGELADRQEASGAPEETWLVADELTKPVGAVELPPSTIRAMAGVTALGLVGTVSLSLILDALGLPRRRVTSADAPSEELQQLDAAVHESVFPPVNERRLMPPVGSKAERQYQ